MGKKLGGQDSLNKELMDFIHRSPTPYHAVQNMIQELKKAGFTPLAPDQAWKLKEGQSYYMTGNETSLVAFTYSKDLPERGLHLVGAHTDSPCLKIKPNPERFSAQIMQLGVEVYGGVLLYTWFDRDLSLAGRVCLRTPKGDVEWRALDFKRPMAIIPSLAIHLNRGVNDSHSINAQKELPPVLLQSPKKDTNLRDLLLEEVGAPKGAEILDYDLCLYDVTAPASIGPDFIASARLDNLLSCFAGLKALLQAKKSAKSALPMLACLDHEEVGSGSYVGAEGPMIQSILERLCPSVEDQRRALARSLMVSCDNAHGLHPNYGEKHDENHGPILNAGPVIKMNANQRYATNAYTASLFGNLCRESQVPFQKFVVRSDMACGSTIGPITASNLGIRVVDVGVPTFAMHSIRELCGAQDTGHLVRVLEAFFESPAFPV